MFTNEFYDYNTITNRYIENNFGIFTFYAILQIDPNIPGSICNAA